MGKLGERIKELRVSAHLTQVELAKKLGVSKGTIGNYETGVREPNRQMQEAIADLFNVELDYLNGRTNQKPEYSLEEQWVISCYRASDEDIKNAVKMILRKFGEQKKAPKKEKVIPLFAAAAGPGEPARDDFDEYEVEEKSPAQFAVKISGDSMEPELHDGDIVLCQRRKPKTGELAVIMVNGFLYVKQYIEAYAGNIYLRSLNRARKDCDVDILASGNDTVTGYGTVIYKPLELVKE